MFCLKVFMATAILAVPVTLRAETSMLCKIERFCTGPTCIAPAGEEISLNQTEGGYDMTVGEKVFAMTEAPTSDPASALRLTGTNPHGNLIIMTVVPGGLLG